MNKVYINFIYLKLGLYGMGGIKRDSKNFDLPTLLFSGIDAFKDPKKVPTYTNNSKFLNISTGKQSPITLIKHAILHHGNDEYYKFKILTPYSLEVSVPELITYELFNEQLYMYFTRFIPVNVSGNNRTEAENAVQEFIDICLETSNQPNLDCSRHNLDKLGALIKAIDGICLENCRRRVAFKKFLEAEGLVIFLQLQRFNKVAKYLGIKHNVHSTDDYEMLDIMLEEMVEQVDRDRNQIPQAIIEYVRHLENLLLLPVSEALKPMVDSNIRTLEDNAFYLSFYKLLKVSTALTLEPEQEFFMQPVRKHGRFKSIFRYRL